MKSVKKLINLLTPIRFVSDRCLDVLILRLYFENRVLVVIPALKRMVTRIFYKVSFSLIWRGLLLGKFE